MAIKRIAIVVSVKINVKIFVILLIIIRKLVFPSMQMNVFACSPQFLGKP